MSRARGLWLLAVGAVGAWLLVSLAWGDGSHAHRRPRPITDPLAHASTLAIGVNLQDGVTVDSIDSFARLVGAFPRVVMWYQTWDEPLFYRSQVEATAARGAIPLITWNPIVDGAGLPLAEIARGDADRYIIASARIARSWHRLLYIRLGSEMNVASSLFGPRHDGNTAAQFVSAWRRVVHIFRAQGADNVRWVWSPNVYCQGRCPFRAYFPGDRWVDWVALDGYNYGLARRLPWLSFARIFGPSYRILTSMTDKPVMIGETASGAEGGSKAAWIDAMATALRSEFRRVRVLVWFQRIKETDWRVNSSAASLAAFRAFVASR
jgi:hypothetical protein